MHDLFSDTSQSEESKRTESTAAQTRLRDSSATACCWQHSGFWTSSVPHCSGDRCQLALLEYYKGAITPCLCMTEPFEFVQHWTRQLRGE